MATINQLTKQIETAKKRLADYKSKALKYSVRAAVNLIKFSELVGTVYTSENISDYSCKADNFKHFDLYCTITSALEYKERNERNARIERKNLDRKEAVLQELIKSEISSTNCRLENTLTEVMADFRVMWVEQMEDYYNRRYDHLRSALPGAISKMERVSILLAYFRKTRGWGRNKMTIILQGISKDLNDVILDKANKLNKPEYMAEMKKGIVKTWNAGITKLADKCSKYKLNEGSIRAYYPSIVDKGFEVVLRDCEERAINARVIWAAENSILVTPHTRYIVTEVKKK